MTASKNIRLVHIDDDGNSLASVKAICTSIPDIIYLAGFSSPAEGLSFVNNQEVDLLLLDIEMPDLTGFDIVKELHTPGPSVIFLSNHAGYVTQAFEACALHYLLKPLDTEMLTMGINKYRLDDTQRKGSVQAKQVDELVTNYLTSTSYPKRIFINQVSKILILVLSEIEYLTSSANYTYFHTTDGEKEISSRNIKTYEEALVGHPDFIRIHRSHIINKNFVISIKKYKNRSAVIMKGGAELDISRAKNDEILKQLLV